MPTATKTKPPLDGWSVSQRHGFDTKLKGLVLGFCLGSALAVAVLPSPNLCRFSRAYLTVYFVVGEYSVVFGAILATTGCLIQVARETAASSERHRVKRVIAEMWWRVLFSPIMVAVLLLVFALFMYFPLILGHIVQIALYGDYQGDTVYGSGSLLYPFNWLHFIVRGRGAS
jgi:phosphotransferase system  glucose/maltose/N-acetylglucosamine-specific IIC component